MACTLQTTSKQVEIHNRLLRPGVSFLYAKRHSEMNATSAIIAARDLVRPPPPLPSLGTRPSKNRKAGSGTSAGVEVYTAPGMKAHFRLAFD